MGGSTLSREREREGKKLAVLNDLEKLADLHSYQAVCGPVSYWPSSRNSGAKSTVSLKDLYFCIFCVLGFLACILK